jgi:isopenicillin-N N-acyltransferase-like protein
MTNTTTHPPVIAVSGSYEDMGIELGRRTADLVAQSLATYEHRFRHDAGLDDATIKRWGLKYWDIASGYNRDIAALMHGLAEGARQPIHRIAALNARTELLFGTGYQDEGCTSVSAIATATSNGHTLIGQNWDWHPEQGPVTFLLATRDKSEFSVLSLTEAGMLAKSGLNSAGIGVCANLLASDRDRGGVGVPYHYLLRGALQSKRMSEAHRNLLPVTRISSGNVLLADAAGESIDFELAPEMFASILPVDGLIVHANHFMADLPLVDRKAATSALTQLRPARLRHLLEEKAAAGQLDVGDIVAGLRDTYSDPDGICRHPDPEVPVSEQIATVYSIVMDLNELSFWIAPASPRDHGYERWDISTIFDDRARPRVEFPPLGVSA